MAKDTCEHFHMDFLGSRLAYRICGSGSPVVLLHGSLVANPWKGFEHLLLKHHKVYIPMMPGFGKSETVPGRVHGLKLFSEALSHFLCAQHLEDAPLVAISYGCIIALRATNTGCTKGRLILVGLPGQTSGKVAILGALPVLVRRLLVSTTAFRRHVVVPTLRQTVGGGKVSMQEHDETTLKQLRSVQTPAIADPDYAHDINMEMRKLIRRVPNRYTLIYGALDKQKTETTDIAKSKIIPDAGHNPFADKPEKMLAVLEKILAK
jgi:pimeloyl-ACP methyl ester carboxylesterase